MVYNESCVNSMHEWGYYKKEGVYYDYYKEYSDGEIRGIGEHYDTYECAHYYGNPGNDNYAPIKYFIRRHAVSQVEPYLHN